MEHLAELAGSFHRPRPLSITSTHSASSKRSDSPGRQSSVMKTTSRAGRSVEGTTFYRPRGSTTLPPKFVLGVAAMDQKARSKPMRNILNRLLSLGEFEIVIFGDKVLLDEEPETWPSCDFLISFFSAGFPMAKALRYVRLAAPFCVNDLAYQQLLWDRRVVLRILDHTGVRTPRRIVANRDLPTLPPDLVEDVRANGGPDLGPTTWPMTDVGVVDADTIRQGSVTLRKPFVEKPVSGEDHNVWIYYPESSGGGVRKLFRKVNNKSSEFVVGPVELRRDGSYVYEEFMTVDNLEDVKVYTIGDSYAHAETRKSPVVDGVVQRNAEGKEIRYITPLTDAERDMARKVCLGFRQAVCGFDLLRAGGNSYVIDVNGWSFVKGNDEYYDNCCHRLRLMFLQAAERRQIPPTAASSEPTLESAWRLKSFVSVLRHADRTPKQKLKFSLRSPPFMALLRGAEEEVVLKKQEELSDVVKAADEALKDGLEDKAHMEQLCMVMDKKGGMAGTKVQVKPVFNKKDRSLEKVQLVVKWGGEFTHAGLHQSKDLGLNLRKDLVLMNRKVLDDVKLYLSSERRVAATAEIFLNTFLNGQELPKEAMVVNRAMLDDSDAAKEQMELVKTKLQEILNAPTGSSKMNLLPPGFILPAEMVDPAVTLTEVIEMMGQLRAIMKENLKTMNMDTIQTKWCCQDTPFLVERWEKLFENFCDVDRSAVEPSKISELYDSCKFDALHNREFLFGLFSNAEHGKELIRRLWYKAKDLFDFVAPQEYGVERSEKLEIGVLSALPLVKKLVQEIEDARDSVTPCTRLFFTKESKIITLLNVIIAAGFPVKLSYSPKEVDEVDYLTQIVFELYERLSQRATTPRPTTPSWPRDYSIRLSFSPGAHDNNVIDTQMDGRHSLSTAPRRWITNHINLDEALALFKSLVEKYDKRVRSTPEIADSVPAPVVGAPAV
ncbi:hypothetical protein M427DRAFT_492247 [Gonapodya prolifera JEL478]|uniref:Inositol hexakisphosphate and diphosphoinositol-pentakisphosphate kinase n=1 Tax=Gonapodya prolifera (strain JEL478) TaxID=1344416 RepID=A0A139AL95_GONPJ|nr:hypothetical protein M427DRAFT_492247 [Gonapodya prolifera JEL478]|eukprot:KXS17559.1 hypothetical protein M427DRAFT_492247 [Gonapodya prolifera JEL478]